MFKNEISELSLSIKHENKTEIEIKNIFCPNSYINKKIYIEHIKWIYQ